VRGARRVRSTPSLGQGRAVEVQRFRHALKHALDGVVDLARRQRDELGGQLGKQRLERKAFGQRALGAAALDAMHDEAGDEGALHQEQDGATRDVPLVLVPH
jgi:hypothetical protein